MFPIVPDKTSCRLEVLIIGTYNKTPGLNYIRSKSEGMYELICGMVHKVSDCNIIKDVVIHR